MGGGQQDDSGAEGDHAAIQSLSQPVEQPFLHVRLAASLAQRLEVRCRPLLRAGDLERLYGVEQLAQGAGYAAGGLPAHASQCLDSVAEQPCPREDDDGRQERRHRNQGVDGRHDVDGGPQGDHHAGHLGDQDQRIDRRLHVVPVAVERLPGAWAVPYGAALQHGLEEVPLQPALKKAFQDISAYCLHGGDQHVADHVERHEYGAECVDICRGAGP